MFTTWKLYSALLLFTETPDMLDFNLHLLEVCLQRKLSFPFLSSGNI